MGFLAAEPVAELEHSAVALRERVEGAVERFLLQAAFGLFLGQRILAGATPKTLEEVGTELGVTRERVRQLESRALRELQAAAPDLRLYLRAE